MIGSIAVGSLVDVATLVSVLVLFRYETQAPLGTLSATAVALAEEHRGVDDEYLRAELEVDEREVDAIRPTIVDGGNGGDRANA